MFWSPDFFKPYVFHTYEPRDAPAGLSFGCLESLTGGSRGSEIVKTTGFAPPGVLGAVGRPGSAPDSWDDSHGKPQGPSKSG